MFDQQRLRDLYREHKVWELCEVPYDKFAVDFMSLSRIPEIQQQKPTLDGLVLMVIDTYKTRKLFK